DIARTLSHEYGHHFTYYYYLKYENKTWGKWAESGYAKARQISANKQISASGTSHYWQIQEIAAEDYVELFGSPTAKKSAVFSDIQERLAQGSQTTAYSTHTYNVQPQENWHLPPAANLPQVREYWLKASGLKDSGNKPPAPVTLRLSDNQPVHAGHRQYVFTWTPSIDDRSAKLEYTLVRFRESYGSITSVEPVRTVYDGMELTARYGAAKNSQMYLWSEVPTGVSYFVILIKDHEGLIVSSNILAVDFTDKVQPETISIDDAGRVTGILLRPWVKVDGEQLNFDVPPVNQNGRILVPLRLIFEKLGAQVTWDGRSRTVTATKPGTVLKLRIGDKFAEVNGRWIELDVPAGIIGGRTLVPVRFVSEAMGAKVDWNERLQLAIIKSA
ncbi:MAG: copper amine oxidase N-terminal domain-containing protein, partial [Bacillota bacterium]